MRVGRRAGVAVVVSLGVHAMIVSLVAHLTGHEPTPRTPTRAGIETRVTFGAEPVREVSLPLQAVTPPEVEPHPPVEPPPSPEVPEPPVATTEPSTGSVPRKVTVPSALPDTLLASVRRFAHAPTPIVDAAVRPAAAVVTARPAHGALAAGKRVVYLLDASGSMGEWGKFAAARDVVAATAACQPAGVDVKVVVYAATAEVVTPAALAAHAPVGRGDHIAGLRLALAQAPDFVVWFTDAADLPTASVQAQLRRAGKPVTLFVARVGPNGVATPTELR